VQRTNQVRRISVGADLAPGFVAGDVWPKVRALPTMKNLPQGISELKLGDSKWQEELMVNFVIALGIRRPARLRRAWCSSTSACWCRS
jgi:multidrug efflux pump subunit AcrB